MIIDFNSKMASFIGKIVLPDGNKIWASNGKYHREDGPAIECPDGTKRWFIKGKEYTEEEFNQYLLIKKLSGLK